jgi:hypothetical protein
LKELRWKIPRMLIWIERIRRKVCSVIEGLGDGKKEENFKIV